MADPRASAVRAEPWDEGRFPTAELLATLFAEARVGFAYWDLDIRYRRINEDLAAMHGVPVPDHIGRRPSEVLPELGPMLDDTLRRVIASGEPLRDVHVAGETPAAPGVTRHWLASYLPVRDAGGAVIGVTAMVVENTGEQRAMLRAEEARRRSESVDAELVALYSALPVGVAFLTPDLRYQRVNETLARMNGRPADAHPGATIEDVLGEPARMLEEALRRVVDTRRPLDIQVSAALPGNPESVRALEATYFPVADAGGELLGVGGVVRDVTDRHELEVEQSRLLREALLARAQAEAAQVRADDAREEAEQARADAERARERMAFLARAGRQMLESIDWPTTLRSVVRSAAPAIADGCMLTIVEPNGRLTLLAVAHRDPDRERVAKELFAEHPPDPAAGGGIAAVIRTGEPEVLHDIDPRAAHAAIRDPGERRLVERLGVRHSVIAPLKAPAGVIGALTFVLGDSGRRFTAEDVDLITSLASRAALHLQNARLYSERSSIARTLQASLRPRALPAIPGADLAARFQAAGEQNEVGGDFYDVFASGDGVWTAIIGDVSGKGAQAAALTALARHTLRTASMLDDGPAANLALLNRALYAGAAARDFCTVFHARICPADPGLDVRFANGGHPAPLLLRADGTVEVVEDGRGPLVGGIPDAAFAEGTLRLHPGDLMLMYTDGVTEVRTSDLGLGDREMRSTLAAHAGRTAGEVVHAVERRAIELQDGTPRDDIALLALKAREPGPEST